MKKTNDFGRDSIPLLVLKVSVPFMFAQFVNVLYSIVDRIYVGNIPVTGADALAGVGVCAPIVTLLSSFGTLFGVGGSVLFSVRLGAGDEKGARKILANSFSMMILVAVVLTAAFLLTKDQLLNWFGASEVTFPYADTYMTIYTAGTVFALIAMGMNFFITAQGFAKTGMLSVLIGAVSNIILDPIFIFGFNMDVRGAALATIISQALSCIWVVWFLCGKKTTLKIKKKNIGLQPKVVLPCVALGTSVFVMQASESVISVCFNSSLQRYGGDIAVGAMTILTSVMQFAMLPLQGLGQGAQPIISYNYGAKNVDRVRATYKMLLKVSLAYSCLLWLLVMLFPQGFAAMFTTDPELMQYTKTALRIYMAAACLFGIQIACQMTFNALGRAVESIVVAVVRKFVLLIPLIYIMPAILSSDKALAVYMAEPAADVIAVAFTAILFAVQFKKTLGKLDTPKAEAKSQA